MSMHRPARVRRFLAAAVLILAALCTAARAQLMAHEERIQNSCYNKEYVTWRSGHLQLTTKTMPEENAVACYRKVLELPARPRKAGLT